MDTVLYLLFIDQQHPIAQTIKYVKYTNIIANLAVQYQVSNNQRMGAGIKNSSSSTLTLSYYSREHHSVQGQVSIYRLKGQQLYIFQKKHTPSTIAKLADKISKSKSPYLCPYFGNLFMNPRVGTIDDCHCGIASRQYDTFWTFQTYSLVNEIDKNLSECKYPTEARLWQIVSSLSQAATSLINNDVFIDFTLSNVHISPLKIIQLYWGNAQPGNAHRLFYQRIMFNSSIIGPLSPEQLLAIKKRKVTVNLDKQKCVMFSMGILLLLFASTITNYEYIYDYKTMQMRNDKKEFLFSILYKQYSTLFVKTLAQILTEEPAKRPNFAQLSELRNSTGSLLQTETNHHLEPSSCSSSKISIKKYYH